MKKTIISIFALVAICSQVSTAQTNKPTAVEAVIQSYLDLKNSLFAGNGGDVQKAGKLLYEAINAVKKNELTPKQLKPWKQYSEKLSYHAEHIKGTADIEHQREHFVDLSDYFYKFLNTSQSNTAELYYEFCPMANNGKGAYWISEEQKISNPYYGEKMATCGSVKDTLQPGK